MRTVIEIVLGVNCIKSKVVDLQILIKELVLFDSFKNLRNTRY